MHGHQELEAKCDKEPCRSETPIKNEKGMNSNAGKYRSVGRAGWDISGKRPKEGTTCEGEFNVELAGEAGYKAD